MEFNKSVYIKSPFEIEAFISYLIITYFVLLPLLSGIVILIHLTTSRLFIIDIFKILIVLSLITFVLIIFDIPFVYLYGYHLPRNDYYIQNGVIQVGSTPFLRIIFIDDIVNIKYVTVHPFKVIFFYPQYYHRYINPPMSNHVYLIDLIDNHRVVYEDKIYRVHDFNKYDWKKVSYQHVIIPKVVLDEYIKNRFYISSNIKTILD